MNERNTSKLLNIDKKNLETNNSVRCILADPQGNIWFTTRYHLNRYTPSTGKIKRIPVGIFASYGKTRVAAFASVTVNV